MCEAAFRAACAAFDAPKSDEPQFLSEPHSQFVSSASMPACSRSPKAFSRICSGRVSASRRWLV